MPSHEQLKASGVRVLILTGYGLNCEAETAHGFRLAGASVDVVHASQFFQKGSTKDALSGYQILSFVGGFSFGDHIQSGRVFANRLRYSMGDALLRFVDEKNLVLGICNGFQVLIKLGLLPLLSGLGETLPKQSVTLVDNDRPGYFNSWVRLAIDEKSPCVFTRGLSPFLECPTRHGEGKLLFESVELRRAVEEAHLVPVKYADRDGQPTTSWPENPNGSEGGFAGLCDRTGRIFGLMPHPDAYIYPESHPDWIAQRDVGQLPPKGRGAMVFENGVRAILEG